ncbi:ubiquitin carboxyl-terminal hydrolase [Russula aff. rugulosa BPL654]|nr:ubiquitin carboxyl-terminal hydrolase [Russula aff. rugulosa BPL654]
MARDRWIPSKAMPSGLITFDAGFQLLDLVAKPVKAVILLFPIRGKLGRAQKTRRSETKEEGRVQVDHTVFWIEQTPNACGTIGLLHTLTNHLAARIEPESPISNFIDACSGKQQSSRSHPTNPTSSQISMLPPQPAPNCVPDNLDTDLHFTLFVQAPDASAREAEVATDERRLIELDGGRAGPVDRGKSTDLLKDVAWYVKEQIFPYAPAPEFSMIALLVGFLKKRLG